MTSGEAVDPRRHVAEYFRLEQWEIVPADGGEGFSEFGGRVPVDPHLRGAGGGLRTGALLTNVDSLGGILCGMSVRPEWIVTTSMMATVSRLSHRGSLRLHGRIVRRGRKAVVAGLEVVDEGDRDQPVAAVTMTCAVLDPGDMELHFERPVVTTMPPANPDPQPPEEFFCIGSGVGPVTGLRLADHLRNPWGILHGGAVATLADIAACRAVASDRAGRAGGHEDHGEPGDLAAADTVLHYLRPGRVGPIEARCGVLGGHADRRVVRMSIHDVGAEDRVIAIASVAVHSM